MLTQPQQIASITWAASHTLGRLQARVIRIFFEPGTKSWSAHMADDLARDSLTNPEQDKALIRTS